jgi:hypothetical protein
MPVKVDSTAERAGITEEDAMVDWSTELEGRRLRISEAAASSLLTILVREGKVRMCLVELTEQPA